MSWVQCGHLKTKKSPSIVLVFARSKKKQRTKVRKQIKMKVRVLTVLGELVEGDLVLRNASFVIVRIGGGTNETTLMPMCNVVFVHSESDKPLSRAEEMAIRLFVPLLQRRLPNGDPKPPATFEKMSVILRCLMSLTDNDADAAARIMYLFTHKCPERFPTTRRLVLAPELTPSDVFGAADASDSTGNVYILRPPDNGCPLEYWFDAVNDLRARDKLEKDAIDLVTMIPVKIVIDGRIAAVTPTYRPLTDTMYALETESSKVFLFDGGYGPLAPVCQA